MKTLITTNGLFMTDGLLENIIQLEKRIQTKVVAEQALANEWQQRELTTLENTFTAAKTAEKERCLQRLTEEKSAILREGAAQESASTAWCKRLSNLDNARLRDLLKQHLTAILPDGETAGGDHDHPHGEG